MARRRQDESLESVHARIAARLVIVVAGAALLIHRGFRATNQPSALETAAARAARNFSIPSAARNEKILLEAVPRIFRTGAMHSLSDAKLATDMMAAALRPWDSHSIPACLIFAQRNTEPYRTAQFTTSSKMAWS